jgi:magnesium transporter
METIYYIYVVDETEHLRGVVSARQLVSAMGQPDRRLGELMETDIAAVLVEEHQEDVALKVAKFDLLAIPVVDAQRKMLGIITHDDVIDVLREEATEDAHRIAAVDPLDESYLKIDLFTLGWKRGMWLTILFIFAFITAIALRHYEAGFGMASWLMLFIPLVISSGGNTGSQSATLVITALATKDVTLNDWARIVKRELVVGLMLGVFLALIGIGPAYMLTDGQWNSILVVCSTLILVVVCGTMLGSALPLLFSRLGLDPALMSSPFVAGIIDILGIVIYMNVAFSLLT